MTATFYVYLNIPNNKTLIHHAECSHCNHGEGRTAMKSDGVLSDECNASSTRRGR